MLYNVIRYINGNPKKSDNLLKKSFLDKSINRELYS